LAVSTNINIVSDVLLIINEMRTEYSY